MQNHNKTVVASLLHAEFVFLYCHIKILKDCLQIHSVLLKCLLNVFFLHVCFMSLCLCVTSLSQRPRWSPLTSLPPPPLTHGGNTNGSTVEETQRDRQWWLQPELCGHSLETHKQVTSTDPLLLNSSLLTTVVPYSHCYDLVNMLGSGIKVQ